VGDILVLATDAGRLVALHSVTLAPLWSRPLPSRAASGIAVHGRHVYLCSGRRLIGVDATTARRVLDVALPGLCFTTPAAAPREDVIVVGTRSGHVVALGLDGRERWQAVTSRGTHNDGSPVIVGNRVLIGSNDGALYSFDLRSGTRQWKLHAGSWVVSTPGVSDGMAYVGDDDGFLRAVSLANGRESWRVRIGDDLASSPTRVGDLIVHGGHDGKLHAHKRDGTSLPPIPVGASVYASFAVAADGTLFISTHGGAVVAVQ